MQDELLTRAVSERYTIVSREGKRYPAVCYGNHRRHLGVAYLQSKRSVMVRYFERD